MLSKARIKFIKSLQIKKYRKQEQCFIVQGAKSVRELIDSDFETLMVIGTPGFLSDLTGIRCEVFEATEAELKTIGEFQSNDAGLAIARMKADEPLLVRKGEFALALDDIRDPGNLGTIIRTADWYGVKTIIASPETADFYNPKVITSTMGSFTRVKVHYEDLSGFLANSERKIYGALLKGRNIYHEPFNEGGIILIGNESRGISTELLPFVTDQITIPRFGHAESLNAAIATAVILDNIKRKSHER
jgi:RNA methyltransferase, TrmH family